eukprot:TRINITY_DN11162_c0_g1_i1.p1 TRINITY_DN11162_c0_g1~~TRINITY_DN11162_c0_g1_i1.p1  ORF type:complete len:422 (+),score=86.12 TRINITY_DN11162_c0_g1_i1:71-1267(+)
MCIRDREQEIEAPKKEKIRIQWKFSTSIFKDYKKDSDELLRKCFEFDWDCSRIQRVVKNPEQQASVKNLLWEIYPSLKEAYKHYSGLGVVGEVFSIPINTFTDFATQCNLLDDTFKLSDLDLKFIATNSSEIKTKNNPDRALTRFKFMEIMVRIAEDKYIKAGLSPNFEDAVGNLIRDCLEPYVTQFNAQKFRDEVYWKEEVDFVYKSYLQLVNQIYKKYSGRKSKPGMKKFMCLDELHTLANHAGLISEDSMVERDVDVIFNLSMMTQVDELYQNRHFEMSFVEFLEAFARIADKTALSPVGSGESESARNQPLHLKLEALLRLVYDRCLDKDTKDSIILPSGSIFNDSKKFYTPLVSLRQTNVNSSQPSTLRRIISRATINPVSYTHLTLPTIYSV